MAAEQPLFVGAIVRVDYAGARFTLPADVLRSVGWALEDVARLIAEFIDAGHIRLHRHKDFLETLESARNSVIGAGRPADISTRLLQVLADQYRDVTFYRSDNNRVSVRAEVMVLLLGPDEPNHAKIFLQAGSAWIDVMTHEVRLARLKEQASVNRA